MSEQVENEAVGEQEPETDTLRDLLIHAYGVTLGTFAPRRQD